MLIYILRKNQDTTEGRGPMIPVAAFESESEIKKVLDKSWIYSKGDGMYDVQSLRLFESELDYFQNNDAKVRERALSKLSAEEKKVLGVK